MRALGALILLSVPQARSAKRTVNRRRRQHRRRSMTGDYYFYNTCDPLSTKRLANARARACHFAAALRHSQSHPTPQATTQR